MEKEQILISSAHQDHPVKKLLIISIPLGLLGIFGFSIMIAGFLLHFHPQRGMITRTSPASVAWFGDLLFNYSFIAVLSVFPTFGVYFWMRTIVSKIVFIVSSGVIGTILFMASICLYVQAVPEYFGGTLALFSSLLNAGLVYVGIIAYKD